MTGSEKAAEQAKGFLDAFFAPPNQLWVGRSPKSHMATYLAPLLAALAARDERPLVLPRRDDSASVATTYVICWDAAHAVRIRQLLQAAVAHNWTHLTGQTAKLDPTDPVEAAVIGLVGPDTTYLLRPPAQWRHEKMWSALRRMIQALDEMPHRALHLPRPVGRVLNDFELALANGQADESQRLLDELQYTGGLSLENQAFLTIRRLSRLGQDAELLAHPLLPTIVMAEPPRAIRDAVLGAWVRVHTESADIRDVETALAASASLTGCRPDIALLADAEIIGLSPDADIALALIAVARTDAKLAGELLGQSLPHAVTDLLTELVDVTELAGASAVGTEPIDVSSGGREAAPGADEVVPPHVPPPAGWVQWVTAAAQSTQPMPPDASQWASAHLCDHELARLVDELRDQDVRMLLAAFIEHDQFGTPAWRTARALMERMLLAEYFTPAELASLHALLEIFLRGAPNEVYYQQVLSAMADYLDRWVSVANALPALDVADTVACGAKPDQAAATAFVAAILAPLQAQTGRLTADLRSLGELITTDLGLGWDWQPAQATTTPPEPQQPSTPLRVLLYSLDEAVLERVERAAPQFAPHLIITKSSDKDGSPQLREKARNSDVVVIATRCATHAATGFITDNCGDARIVYPDGAGSASMIRALAGAVT